LIHELVYILTENFLELALIRRRIGDHRTEFPQLFKHVSINIVKSKFKQDSLLLTECCHSVQPFHQHYDLFRTAQTIASVNGILAILQKYSAFFLHDDPM